MIGLSRHVCSRSIFPDSQGFLITESLISPDVGIDSHNFVRTSEISGLSEPVLRSHHCTLNLVTLEISYSLGGLWPWPMVERQQERCFSFVSLFYSHSHEELLVWFGHARNLIQLVSCFYVPGSNNLGHIVFSPPPMKTEGTIGLHSICLSVCSSVSLSISLSVCHIRVIALCSKLVFWTFLDSAFTYLN